MLDVNNNEHDWFLPVLYVKNNTQIWNNMNVSK